MNSSGIKRGLAVFAISAIAVAGIPALAQANSVASQVAVPQGVQLYNTNISFGGPIDLSSRPDGTDSTVRLEAGGGSNVARVTFQVSRNGLAFSDIATVTRNDDGAFFFEWTPTNEGVFPGDNVEIRAFNADNPAFDDFSGVMTARNATNTNTNTINIAAGSEKGYFADPNNPGDNCVGVVGTISTQSTPGDNPGLAWMDGAGNEQNATFDTTFTGSGFEGILRVTEPPYVFDNPALPPAEDDQLVVRAVTDYFIAGGDETDDFESYTLYEQTITTVNAVVGTSTFPDPKPVTITVLDQNGNPVACAEVRDNNGVLVGTTRGDGTVGDFLDPNDNTTFYYANATASDPFEPGAGDKRSNDVSNDTASVSITSNPANENQPVGTTVTETITIRDENEQLVANRLVRITRRGPGSVTQVVYRTTNGSGVVTYSFTGNSVGTAAIEAAIADDSQTAPFTDAQVVASATDFVNFRRSGGGGGGGDNVLKVQVRTGNANGGRTDIFRIIKAADRDSLADGARVVLFQKVNGRNTRLGATNLDGRSRATFLITDRRPGAIALYFAKVARTGDTPAGTSPVKKIR